MNIVLSASLRRHLLPKRGLWVAVWLLLLMIGAAGATAGTAPTALQIVDVQANATTVGLYEKFELTFAVQGSVATNPNFPYDPNPPPNVPAGVGITVEGLFTPDNWQTVLVQPGFLYQAYESRCIGDTAATGCRNGRNWLYPQGEPVWKVRFAPQQTGTWRYRLRVTDASGTAQSGEGTFTVVPSSDPYNHGFIRIAAQDPGLFEYTDGTPFIGVGYGSGFDNARFTFAVDEEMARVAANRVNFLRIWMSGSGIYMAPWNPWHSHHLPGEGGYLNPASLTYAVAYADHLFSLRLWDYPDPAMENRRNPCMFQGFSNDIAVKPNTTYQLRVRVKTVGVTGPRDGRYPFGFTVRTAGWLGDTCADPAQTEGISTPLLGHVNGNTEWTEVTGTLTTGPDRYFLDNLYLILENTTGGNAYVDEVSLREVVAGQPSGPEVLRKGRFAYHLYFDPLPAWQWDYILDRAAQNGVTVRPVVLEKNDWIANHLDANGNPVGGYYELDNNRFYAAPGTTVRRLHEYFWRYLIARWGYARAVHSWELLNEGDPYNGNHYAMADAFGRFMDQHDPHGHLVTTSTWHSFPVVEFWSNPAYAGVDYADIHEYACCGNRYAGWARNIGDPLQLEQRPAYVYGGRGAAVRIPGNVRFPNAGSTPRSLAIRGRGEWVIRYRMKAEGFTGTCEFGLPNSLAGPRLLWILDDAQSSVVPPPAEAGKSWLCTAPAGTYDWRTFDSRTTHDGLPAPLSERIILNDDATHALSIHFQNGFGTGGNAWIDEVELIGPDGRSVYLNGDFDPTVLYDDSAHLTASLSQQIGGRTPSGPGKPVTRGEVAIGDDADYRGDENHDQRLDTQGVWLHHFLWAQVNPGGLYELYWDPTHIRNHNLYFHFRAFRDFMDGIPLNNGRYADLRAVASHPDVIVLGQVDRSAGRGHLWARHRQYTWRNVVDGMTIPPVTGTITVPDLAAGTYRITWWNAWNGTPFLTEDLTHPGGGLVLTVPTVPWGDIAARFAYLADAPTPTPTPTPSRTPTVTPTRTPTPIATPTPTPTSAGTGVVEVICRPDAAPETTTVDGFVERNRSAGETFAALRSGSGTQARSNAAENRVAWLVAGANANTFNRLRRGVITCDTRGIPAGASVVEAWLYLYGRGKTAGLGATDLVVVPAMPQSDRAVVAADYGRVGTTELGSIGYGAFVVGAYNGVALTPTAIVPGGITRLGLRLRWDVSGTFTGSWRSSSNTGYTVAFAEAGVARGPYLRIRYTAGGSGPTATPTPTVTPTPTPSRTPTATPTPTPTLTGGTSTAWEWSQHAHDAQHTGYTEQTVPYPWRLRWIWNGVSPSGGVQKVTTGGSLPRNVQPVTGGGRVYIAAGVDGVFALGEATGAQLWQRSGIGDVRSTVAYDADTGAVFVVSTNGTLYKLRASDGAILSTFASGQSSQLPLPPIVLGDRVVFAMGNSVYAVNKTTLASLWTYDAGATVAVPPAYSPSRDLVIVATEPDLYVHAVRNGNGTRQWRVRPVHTSRNFADPTEYRYGWPVIAENAGYVLVKVRLDWEALWRTWPRTNPEMRQFLTDNPDQQALFVLDLDDGSIPYIANVGHGGYGDSDYLPMGPQPVVKRLANGKDIVYTVIRAHRSYDSRWDSHFGEMVLDDTTVSGLTGGDVRFIIFDWPPGDPNPFLLTDEQPNVSMAGDYLFGGHWEAGFAARILDRSDARGSFTNPITTQRLSTVVTSQDDTGACAFSASHYCPSGLFNTRGYDFGFYIYYNQGAVYDQYWSEYAVWVVSNDNVYFRSTDGAIIALTGGNPQTTTTGETAVPEPVPSPDPEPIATIFYSEARAWAGHHVTVVGTLQHVVNNGKHVLLGFASPHQGSFKAIIRRQDWPKFAPQPDILYQEGQTVQITGVIRWYQGDPAIFVTAPDQIVGDRPAAD